MPITADSTQQLNSAFLTACSDEIVIETEVLLLH